MDEDDIIKKLNNVTIGNDSLGPDTQRADHLEYSEYYTGIILSDRNPLYIDLYMKNKNNIINAIVKTQLDNNLLEGNRLNLWLNNSCLTTSLNIDCGVYGQNMLNEFINMFNNSSGCTMNFTRADRTNQFNIVISWSRYVLREQTTKFWLHYIINSNIRNLPDGMEIRFDNSSECFVINGRSYKLRLQCEDEL